MDVVDVVYQSYYDQLMKKIKDRQAFEQITLKNGIEIYYYPEKSPISLATVIAPFGSAHNTSINIHGSAHLLEHMVLQRSKLHPQAKGFAKKIDAMGGYINGSTYSLETDYSFGVPSGDFDLAWEGFIDQIFHPIFKQEDIVKQANIILSEKKRERYYPAQSELDQYIYTKWIDDCPYTIDQIYGKSSKLNKLTPAVLTRIHQNYFRKPLRVLLAGDINLKKVVESLENYPIKHSESGVADTPLRWINREYHELSFEEINRWEYRLGGLQTLPINNLQKYALVNFIIAFISNHYQGVLYKWLREELGWAYELNASIFRRKDKLFWSIYIPLHSSKQVSIVRKELIERIRCALKDSTAIAQKIDRQIGRTSFYYQTLGEIINDAAYDLNIYSRVISENEWLKYIVNCNDSKLLVQIWDELVEKDKIGEFTAIPLAE